MQETADLNDTLRESQVHALPHDAPMRLSLCTGLPMSLCFILPTVVCLDCMHVHVSELDQPNIRFAAIRAVKVLPLLFSHAHGRPQSAASIWCVHFAYHKDSAFHQYLSLKD